MAVQPNQSRPDLAKGKPEFPYVYTAQASQGSSQENVIPILCNPHSLSSIPILPPHKLKD